MIDAHELISKILEQPCWLDGTCVVISRDAVIEIIEELNENNIANNDDYIDDVSDGDILKFIGGDYEI